MQTSYWRRPHRAALAAIAFAALMVGGCGGGGGGNAERGRQLFAGELAYTTPDTPGCTMCHNVVAEQGAGLGPNLAGIGTLAASRVPGQSAQQYLETALLNPDAYLVEGYQEGIMYRGYAQSLTPQEVADLVAYMLTLK